MKQSKWSSAENDHVAANTHLGMIKCDAENAGSMPAFQISYHRTTPAIPNLQGNQETENPKN